VVENLASIEGPVVNRLNKLLEVLLSLDKHAGFGNVPAYLLGDIELLAHSLVR
jgi:hypothetical protein